MKTPAELRALGVPALATQAADEAHRRAVRDADGNVRKARVQAAVALVLPDIEAVLEAVSTQTGQAAACIYQDGTVRVAGPYSMRFESFCFQVDFSKAGEYGGEDERASLLYGIRDKFSELEGYCVDVDHVEYEESPGRYLRSIIISW